MHSAAFFAATLLAAASSVSHISALEINGWYPCGPTTKPRAGDIHSDDSPDTHFQEDDKLAFECAQVAMPLCHDGLCKAEAGERLNVFVKRIAAKPSPVQNGEPAKSLWFLQGGPGSASDTLEPRMFSTYKDLNGTVSLYTLDHRGTGRSNFLRCDAAQVDTDGSEKDKAITDAEMPLCLKDLSFRYKDKAAAFSITSAAMDVKKLIEGLTPQDDVYVNGFSYGTSLLQRLVQLQPSQVRGYIFDGVSVMTNKNDKIQTQWSREGAFLIESTRRLLEACFDDASCPLKFKSRKTVVQETLAILVKLDKQVGKNLCSDYLVETGLFKKPSDSLRSILMAFAPYLPQRDYIPLVFAKMKTCSQEDLDSIGLLLDPFYGQWDEEAPGSDSNSSTTVAAAKGLLAHVKTSGGSRRFLEPKSRSFGRDDDAPSVVDPVRDSSDLLFDLLLSSELYGPLPSLAELKQLYQADPLGRVDGIVAEIRDDLKELFELEILGLPKMYCRSTGSNEEICKSIQGKVPMSPTFFYKTDKYHDARVQLTDKASVLVLNGGLDFQTPVEYGDLLMKKLEGGRGKLSVTFKYGGHCRGEAQLVSMKMPCRNAIVQQFVANGGDVAKIDQSCLKQQPKPVFPTKYVPVE